MFKRNRERLFEVTNGSLVVLSAYDTMQYSGDMEAPFLQESSFWWLTGVEEAGWKVVIDGIRRRTILVRPERSHIDTVFNGVSPDETVLERSGADEIILFSEFEPFLRQLHRKHSVAYTLVEQHTPEFVVNPASKRLIATLKRTFDAVQDCTPLLHKLRAIKQPDEITIMKRAIDVSVEAFSYVQQHIAEFKNECEIEAEFSYRFLKVGAKHAYQPVVAAGQNSCTLHYVRNNNKIAARDMIVIDIGARVDGYSADITRTYCRNPTKRQLAVHGVVERAHQAIIELITPGLLVSEYITQSDAIMKQALIELGLLDDIDDAQTYRRYFPHAISHGLGVDTHDSLGAPRYFEAGMILTVEPGIYIPEEAIGVRIEDDILVTDNGHINLSGKLPTSIN